MVVECVDWYRDGGELLSGKGCPASSRNAMASHIDTWCASNCMTQCRRGWMSSHSPRCKMSCACLRKWQNVLVYGMSPLIVESRVAYNIGIYHLRCANLHQRPLRESNIVRLIRDHYVGPGQNCLRIRIGKT